MSHLLIDLGDNVPLSDALDIARDLDDTTVVGAVCAQVVAIDSPGGYSGSAGVFCEGCAQGTIPGVRWPATPNEDARPVRRHALRYEVGVP